MLCEDANLNLVDYAEGSLDTELLGDLQSHLETCATCQADYAAIHEWQSMAQNWHDEIPKGWQIPKIESQRPDVWEGLRQWFPTFASATALVLVTVMYFNQPLPNGILPGTSSASIETLPQLPQAQQAAVVDSVLESSREQRKEELNALLQYLTAEMNRRSIETEESLRFLVSSQIQGQKELDGLYHQIESLLTDPTKTQTPTNADSGQAAVAAPAGIDTPLELQRSGVMQ